MLHRFFLESQKKKGNVPTSSISMILDAIDSQFLRLLTPNLKMCLLVFGANNKILTINNIITYNVI